MNQLCQYFEIERWPLCTTCVNIGTYSLKGTCNFVDSQRFEIQIAENFTTVPLECVMFMLSIKIMIMILCGSIVFISTSWKVIGNSDFRGVLWVLFYKWESETTVNCRWGFLEGWLGRNNLKQPAMGLQVAVWMFCRTTLFHTTGSTSRWRIRCGWAWPCIKIFCIQKPGFTGREKRSMGEIHRCLSSGGCMCI